MDRAIAKPDVFLAYYLSIIADERLEERHLTTATAMALTLLLAVSCVLCGVAVGVLS